MGIGAIPPEHPLSLGMIGSHGVHAANHAVSNADLVVILGARVGDRAMGTAGKLAQKARIIHIDIDPAEIGKNIRVAVPVVGDVKLVLQELLEVIEKGDTSKWLADLEKIKNRHSRREAPAEGGTVKPQNLLALLSEMTGENTIITTEVGQNQIWAANHFKVKGPRTFISSGGMGTMGYGLPSAAGVKVGRPDAEVIAVCGDGSFQMSMQELGTIKQEGLGIKVIIFNNSRLGMVREIQKTRYCGRYSGVMMEHNPDFIKLAEAYGMKAEKISTNSEVKPALERMLAADGAYLLECVVDPDEPTL